MIKNVLFTVASLLLFGTSVHANQFNLEIKGEYENWNPGLEMDSATAVLGGVGIGYYKNDYYAGTGFAMGTYSSQPNDDRTVQRIDFDAVIGKKLDQQWSVFTGYRFNRLNIESQQTPELERIENTFGLGLGISMTVPFAAKVIGFVSGSVSGLYSYNNVEQKGTGYSVGMDGGVLYSVNQKTSISLRVKYQGTEISYDKEDLQSNDQWHHNYTRIGVQLGYLL